MTQLDDVQNFANENFPLRAITYLASNPLVAFDGDPNSGGAPLILQNAAVGTFYLRETPIEIYRKLSPGSTTWVLQGDGSGGASPIFINENMVLPVDYNDVSAVDPPPGTSWTTQQEADDFLTANSATNFKHIKPLWDALAFFFGPGISVDFDMAAGIHRPDAAGRPDFTSWSLDSKFVLGRTRLIGRPVSEWTVVSGLTGLAIAAVTTGGPAPSIQAVGTPFTGLDLKGFHFNTTAGQSGVIVSNTADTLFVAPLLCPAPSPGSDTLQIIEPATILMNSLDDTTRANFSSLAFDFISGTDFSQRRAVVSDIMCQGGTSGGSQFIANFGDGMVIDVDRCVVDNDNAALPAALKDGGGYSCFGKDSFMTPNDCTFRALGVTSADEALRVADGAQASPFVCYFSGGDPGDGVEAEREGVLRVFNCVLEGTALQNTNSRVNFESLGNAFGVTTKIVDPPAGRAAIQWNEGARSLQIGTGIVSDYTVEGATGPCVALSGSGKLDTQQTFLDGGGNTDVGIEIEGVRNDVELNAATDITGTVGDVRLVGTVGPYGDLPAPTDSIADQSFDGFNLVNKVP